VLLAVNTGGMIEGIETEPPSTCKVATNFVNAVR
jgi:hypothetical protein